MRKRAACVFEIDACKTCLQKAVMISFSFFGGGMVVALLFPPTSAPRRVREGPGGDWTGTYLGDVDEVSAVGEGLVCAFCPLAPAPREPRR